jgi:hypothetical protein
MSYFMSILTLIFPWHYLCNYKVII